MYLRHPVAEYVQTKGYLLELEGSVAHCNTLQQTATHTARRHLWVWVQEITTRHQEIASWVRVGQKLSSTARMDSAISKALKFWKLSDILVLFMHSHLQYILFKNANIPTHWITTYGLQVALGVPRLGFWTMCRMDQSIEALGTLFHILGFNKANNTYTHTHTHTGWTHWALVVTALLREDERDIYMYIYIYNTCIYAYIYIPLSISVPNLEMICHHHHQMNLSLPFYPYDGSYFEGSKVNFNPCHALFVRPSNHGIFSTSTWQAPKLHICRRVVCRMKFVIAPWQSASKRGKRKMERLNRNKTKIKQTKNIHREEILAMCSTCAHTPAPTPT